jgi:hypothetical protein
LLIGSVWVLLDRFGFPRTPTPQQPTASKDHHWWQSLASFQQKPHVA